MGATKIKKIDVSQIRYTPQVGEVVQDATTGKFMVWTNEGWNTVKTENSGINMGLYEMNKQIISQLPKLTEAELFDRDLLINTLHAKFNNEFYMLYGKEISYFTLFRIFDSIRFGNEVIDCLNNVGDIKAIDFTEAQDTIEIWIQDEDGPTCLYLFPYDSGVVQVGE